MPPDREGFGESRSPPEAETIISSAAASQPRANGWVSAEGIEASRANCTRGALAWTCAAGVGYPPKFGRPTGWRVDEQRPDGTREMSSGA
jgi:hypothetical protein